MKKAWGWAAALLGCALLLTGCGKDWIRMVNLQDRAIVQGVGVDWDGREFLVTMQIFSPDGSGGQTMIDPSKENARMISCRGATIAEAVENSSRDQGKEFYLGHNRIVILGREAAQLPLKAVLSYFVNSLDSRPDVNLLLTEGSAAEVLSAGITQSILPAMAIEKTVQNAQRSGFAEEMLLIDVLQDISQPHRGTVMPLISCREPEGEKDLRAVEISGMGVFSDEGYVGSLTGGEVRGLLMLRGSLQGAVYTLHTETYRRAAVQLYREKTKVIPAIRDGKPAFRAEIQGKWILEEKFLNSGAAFTEESLRELEEALSRKIQGECEAAFRRTMQEYRQDVCFFGDLVWHGQPEIWKLLESGWPESAEGAVLECQVESVIDRTGLEGVESSRRNPFRPEVPVRTGARPGCPMWLWGQSGFPGQFGSGGF